MPRAAKGGYPRSILVTHPGYAILTAILSHGHEMASGLGSSRSFSLCLSGGQCFTCPVILRSKYSGESGACRTAEQRCCNADPPFLAMDRPLEAGHHDMPLPGGHESGANNRIMNNDGGGSPPMFPGFRPCSTAMSRCSFVSDTHLGHSSCRGRTQNDPEATREIKRFPMPCHLP